MTLSCHKVCETLRSQEVEDWIVLGGLGAGRCSQSGCLLVFLIGQSEPSKMGYVCDRGLGISLGLREDEGDKCFVRESRFCGEGSRQTTVPR